MLAGRLSRPPTVAAGRTLTALAMLLALALGQGEPAWAATFIVNPVQVRLSAAAKSGVLTTKNASPDPIRFQLNLFAWGQSPQGEMQLTPTRDLVFFPVLFTLAPGEERIIRVGATVPPGAVEKTYRIFIEELPPAEGAPPSTKEPGQVKIRTRVGIPIFVRPIKEVAASGIEDLALSDGRLVFEIKNSGTVHFVAQAIRITGRGAAGETVLEGALEGWYVLAGGSRRYQMEIPEDRCPKVRTLVVEVQTAETTLNKRLDATPAACRQ
jgi:fimbrial chaperone protein